MKKIVLIISASIMLFSCGKEKSTKEKITGKWRGVSQENPQLDMMYKQGLVTLDTVGNSTTPEQNMELYGTTDIAAFKVEQKRVMDSFMRSQESYTKSTTIDLRNNGIVYFNFSGDIDSANWEINEKGELIFDEMKLKGSGEKLTMLVEYVSDTGMKLKFNEQDFVGSVTFHPEK